MGQVRVEVVPKIVEPQFQNVSYTQVSEGLWDIRFDISNSYYGEVGIEQNGVLTSLSIELDNNYYVQVYNTNCVSGTSVCDFTGKVYLISRSGKKVYTFPKILAYFSPETALNYIANADEEIGSGVEINNAVTDSLKWGVSQVKGAVKKVDITKNLRNWDNLTALQQEDFYEGVRDTLSLNNFHDVAVNIGAGVAIDKVATIIGKALIAKYGKKVAIKLGAKMVPYLGWALLGYSIGTAGSENVEYMTLCASENLSTTKDGKGPLYYCGKLTVNGMFIGAGLGVSRLHSVGVYKRLDTKNLLLTSKQIDPADSSGLLTKAGHALTKHNPSSRPGSAFPIPTGNPNSINTQADTIVSNILNHPSKTISISNDGQVVNIYSDLYNKGGVRYSIDGTFITFLEP